MTEVRAAEPLLEHLFRREAGRMTAHLARLFGPANLELAEDAVQESMLRALQTWPFQGAPENPTAWLFHVARNAAIDSVRRKKLLGQQTDELVAELSCDDLSLEEQLRDDELRMIIMCCHPALSRDSSVALALKTVGGFSVREIARAFLADEPAVAQRLVRAKRQIRAESLTLDVPRGAELHARLASVLDVLYFMFNEGYAAHEGEDLIRQDLCGEALRLARLISTSSIATPQAHALAALMAFQAARLPARVDEAGDLVLLEAQDHSRWDRDLITLGFHHFDRSIAGDEVSTFHVQAAIAATHARAADSHAIDWRMILDLYDQLMAIQPSSIVALNRAVALAKVHGPAEALAAIEPLDADPKLSGYYLLLAVRGHLLDELGRCEEARTNFQAALNCPCSEPERRFLQRKLNAPAPSPIAPI